ncbi:arylsulfatase B [Rhipicephalus sanguineus]|uniref:arylsulfatase B n=1 Tax=Rhipicephalus sanguineus TaxID=34632 RepID=UPI001894BE25|nr:arylsulfatase B [Rhipicephalus sanguineus]
MIQPQKEHVGLDLRDNETPDWGENGTYATHLFTDKFLSLIENHDKSKPFFGYFSHIAPHVGGYGDPFQAPRKNVRKFSYIGHKDRTNYAGMVDALDESVGAVVDALNRTGMLNDTIIVFSSDNGASLQGADFSGGSSWPFRGYKATLWEGGLRAPGFVWSTRLKKRRRLSRQLMHIVDWLPTLYSAAGGNVEHLGPTDGFDMWHALSEGTEWPRLEILHNVDPASRAMALRVGRYKILVQAPKNDSRLKNNRHPVKGMDHPLDDLTRLRAASRTATVFKSLYGSLRFETDKKWTQEATVKCASGASIKPPKKGPYLFDIERDPCETRNLAASHKTVLRTLYKKLNSYMSQMVAPRKQPEDPRSYPENFGGVWSPWLD